MITRKHAVTSILVACALALVAMSAGQKAIERPMKIEGHITLTINLETGSAVMLDWGEATHTGRFDNQGAGTFDFNSGTLSGGGTFTAANGDKVFWEQTVPFEVVATGGTGRFENIEGGFQYAPTSEPVIDTNPETKTMIITFTYKGAGTITY